MLADNIGSLLMVITIKYHYVLMNSCYIVETRLEYKMDKKLMHRKLEF